MGYDDQMSEKDDDITHLGTVSEPKKTRDFWAEFSNSPWTGLGIMRVEEFRFRREDFLAEESKVCLHN